MGLCAGITLYDPLKHWGACDGKPMTIGIIGIGGLGTMGIKLAKALGHTVGAISTSKGKEALAKEKGASIFVVSTDPASVTEHSNKFDLILNTVSGKHEMMTYIPLLKTNGTLVQLGLVPEPHTMSQLPLVFKRKAVAGSLIGGISNTEELLKLCAEKNVLPDVQLVEADKIHWAWEQLVHVNKDGVRYVIDIKKSLANTANLPPKE